MRRRAVIGLMAAWTLAAGCVPTAPPPASTVAPAPTSPPAPTAAPTTAPAPQTAAPAPQTAAPAKPTSPPAPTATAVPAVEALKVGFSNITPDNLALWYAQDMGIFGRHQLTVDSQLVSGGSTTTAALLSGQVDITQAGGSEALGAVANGADLVIVATASPVYPYVFEVAPEIKTAEDLKGTKVGVATIGGSADVATRVMLRKAGLDPEKDVTIVATGSSQNRTAAMLGGAIQGGMAQGPPDTLTLEAKGFHPLFNLAELKLPNANTAVVVQRSWLNGHKAAMQRYVDSQVEATARMKRDREGTIAVLKKNLKSEDEPAMAASYDFFVGDVLPPLPFPKADQFADSIEQLAEKNPRIKDVDLSKVLDTSFVQSAADRGLDKLGG